MWKFLRGGATVIPGAMFIPESRVTNSLKKNALTELFRKEREEDFDSRESLELPEKSVSLAIYKTEFLKMSLIIIQTNTDLKLFERYIFSLHHL
jgi:hypothetical protein